MPGCDSLPCRSSCGARAHRPPCRIDSGKSARLITIPSADYQCCGARRNRRSIAWEKIGSTMEATRVSISASLLLVPPHPRPRNRRHLLRPAILRATSPSRQQDITPQDAQKAQTSHPPNPGAPRRAISPGEGLLTFPLRPQGSSQTVLHCAHRTSTVLSCAFCEHQGWSGCSPPSF